MHGIVVIKINLGGGPPTRRIQRKEGVSKWASAHVSSTPSSTTGLIILSSARLIPLALWGHVWANGKVQVKPKKGRGKKSRDRRALRSGKWKAGGRFLIPQVTDKSALSKTPRMARAKLLLLWGARVIQHKYGKKLKLKTNDMWHWNKKLLESLMVFCLDPDVYVPLLSVFNLMWRGNQTKKVLYWRLHNCGASVHREANPVVFACFIFPTVKVHQ